MICFTNANEAYAYLLRWANTKESSDALEMVHSALTSEKSAHEETRAVLRREVEKQVERADELERRWTAFCPECGGRDIVKMIDGTAPDHHYCAICKQELFFSVDYSDSISENLKQRLDAISSLTSRNTDLIRRLDERTEKLEKYGAHLEDCAWTEPGTCSCGFDAKLSPVAEKPAWECKKHKTFGPSYAKCAYCLSDPPVAENKP